MRERILLVDDEPIVLQGTRLALRAAGFSQVETLEDSREVEARLKQGGISVMVLDLSMPALSGHDVLATTVQEHPELPVIIMTASNDLATAVNCMKAGAFDYIVKPVDNERLVSSVRNALELSALRAEAGQLRQSLLSDALESEESFSGIVTVSKNMRTIFRYVAAVAGTSYPILITGETGTGKELIARATHALSNLSGRFVDVNVAGLDDTMFSDTLFGHVKGAYTGTVDSREGLIARASGGTLFLDEIGDLSQASQTKLLRLLQERTYYPLGSDISSHCDARIIVATNHDLAAMVEDGDFRRDLYFRLRTHSVSIPPLRERREDIPPLLNHFLGLAAERMQKPMPSYPPELIKLLRCYDFPGNVRELETMVYDAVGQHSGGVLSMDRFKAVISLSSAPSDAGLIPSEQADQKLKEIFGGFPTLSAAVELLVDEAMRLAEGNQSIAASMLGITRQALNKRLKRRK